MLTKPQWRMLQDLDRDNEPTDYADFVGAGTLAWRNRERVIEALIRKGLIDEDLKVKPAGRVLLLVAS